MRPDALRQEQQTDQIVVKKKNKGNTEKTWGLVKADILKSCILPKIDLQIRWHRLFDMKVPRAKDLPSRKVCLQGETMPADHGAVDVTRAASIDGLPLNAAIS